MTSKSGINETARKMTGSKEIWRNTSMLAVAGGVAFWATNFAISLTPIAAEYRAALSISYSSMLFEALVGGLIIGFCVSYALYSAFDHIPTNTPILKSMILSFIVLVIVTGLIEAPAKLLTPANDALRYFFIGAVFNMLRILALGIVIGYLYDKVNVGSK